MEFKRFEQSDLREAAALLSRRHSRERRIFPALKREFEESRNTEKLLCALLEKDGSCGLCAYEGERMQGFLLSRIDYGPTAQRRAYVPYEGMAAAEGVSPEIYRQLYAQLSLEWLYNGALCHYAEVPAGYGETVEAWLKLSFAFQQVYGIASLKRAQVSIPEGITVRRADRRDTEALRGVSHLISSLQAGPPVYAPMPPEAAAEIREGYGGLPEDADSTVLAAYRGEKLVGFLCADTKSDDTGMMTPQNSFGVSVCATVPESRGRGIATALTGLTMNWAIAKGYENAIGDWRIANPHASNFWPGQGFRPVAYRMFRPIEEAVYWAKGRVTGE